MKFLINPSTYEENEEREREGGRERERERERERGVGVHFPQSNLSTSQHILYRYDFQGRRDGKGERGWVRFGDFPLFDLGKKLMKILGNSNNF